MSAAEAPRVAVVTGAGTGIGLAAVHRLAGQGFDIAMLGRRREVLEEAAQEVVEASGRQVRAFSCDVSDATAVAETFAAVGAELGAPRVLVNNAGVLVPSTVLKTGDEDWSAMVDINLRGTFLCSRQAAADMKAAGLSGCIVNVASMLGQVPVSGFAAYGATKAAIIQFTKVCALEFARFGIRANAVLPGYVSTPMSDGAREDPALLATIVERIPAGRFATPDEIAGAVGYLVSEEAEYITGTPLLIDGGYSLRP